MRSKFKTIQLSIIGGLWMLFFAQCNRNLDALAEKGMGVAKENCFRCHAPIQQNVALPLDRIYKKLGEKGLSHYLIKEFKRKNNFAEEHQQIFLIKREKKELESYLKVLGGELLPY